MNPHLSALLDWRSWAVFGRNARVYLRNWKTAFLPPAMEPVLLFLAIGLGLGSYIGSMDYSAGTVRYVDYVAPGMVAYSAFTTAFYEALYGSFVRMFYQKTWDGLLATQVELYHIVWGEALWAGARGMMNATVVALVLVGFHFGGVIDLAWWTIPLVPLLGFVAGWVFASFALIFTALVPSIDHMNYPVFLIGFPLGLVSNTYFPVESEQIWLNVLIQANPVYHLAESYRGLLLDGTLSLHVLWLLLIGAAYLVACMALTQRLARRRVIGE